MSKMVLCDTCVLVDFVNGRSEQITELKANALYMTKTIIHYKTF
jgi:hypothetical protein